MANLRQAIAAVLSADAQVSTSLYGGIYWDRHEMSRTVIPETFDSAGVMPCAFIKLVLNQQVQPYDEAVRSVVNMYLYEPFRSSILDTVAQRIITLLNNQKVGADDWCGYFTNDLGDLIDSAIGAKLVLITFDYYRVR